MNRAFIPDSPGPALLTGNYFYTASQTGSTTINTLGTGALRLVSWQVPRTLSLSALAAEVTTIGDVGSKFRIALYADSGSGLPGALVVDAGQIAGDSATVQSLSVSVTLQPGVYWIGGAVQSVTTTQITMRAVNNWVPPVPVLLGTSLPSAGGSAIAIQMSGVTGAAPSTFTGTTPVGGCARIIAKVA
jgi:hypothetical protein